MMSFRNLFAGVSLQELQAAGFPFRVQREIDAGYEIASTLHENGSDISKLSNVYAEIIRKNAGSLETYLYDNLINLKVIRSNPDSSYSENLKNIKDVMNFIFENKFNFDGVAKPNADKLFCAKGKSRITKMDSWKGVNDNYLKDVEDSGWLPTWEYLNCGLAMYVVDKGDGKVTYSLVTKSEAILRSLSKYNMLYADKGVVVINDILERLNPASDKKNLLDGKTAVLKLEWQSSVHAYKCTVTSKAEMDNMYMIPLIQAEAMFLSVLSSIDNDGKFIAVRHTNMEGKDVVSKVTAAVHSVKYWYRDIVEASSVAILSEKVDYSNIGFDIQSMVFRLFNLEASIHGKITTSIKPGTIKGIAVGNPKTVDISCHDIDYSLLSLVFHTKVSRMTKADFDAISDVIPLYAPTVRAKKEALLAWQAKQAPDDLYRLLTYPNAGIQTVFGNNIREALIKRKNYLPKYLKNFTPLDMETVNKQPNKTPEEVLNKIMQDGVLHARVRSSRGTIREVYLTKNEAILKHLYGDNYLALYGSRRARLKVVRELLNGKKYNELMDILRDYGLEDFTAWKVYDTYSKTFENLEKAVDRGDGVMLGIIDAEIMKLAERDIDSIEMVTGYKVKAYSLVTSNGSVSLYDCFNTSNIVSLEYSVV